MHYPCFDSILIYHGIHHGRPPHLAANTSPSRPACSPSPGTVLVNSFTRSFTTTGPGAITIPPRTLAVKSMWVSPHHHFRSSSASRAYSPRIMKAQGHIRFQMSLSGAVFRIGASTGTAQCVLAATASWVRIHDDTTSHQPEGN